MRMCVCIILFSPTHHIILFLYIIFLSMFINLSIKKPLFQHKTRVVWTNGSREKSWHSNSIIAAQNEIIVKPIHV